MARARQAAGGAAACENKGQIHTAAHAGKGRSRCQPWERLTECSRVRPAVFHFAGPCSMVAGIHKNRLRHGGGAERLTQRPMTTGPYSPHLRAASTPISTPTPNAI